MFDEAHVIYRYKYLPFSKGALKTITEGTIKFTSPLEFNDPFDCMPYYDTESIKDIPRLRPALFKVVGDRIGLSPGKRLRQKGKILARLRKHVDSGAFSINLLRGVGVVSLSKNALSIPMWSHYADFHRGLVLEFRIPIKGNREDACVARDRLLPFPIHYKAERPHIKIGTENPQDLVDKVVLAKSLDWAYEEERVIAYERSPGIYPYRRDDILSSVIAGLKMSDDNFRELQSLVAKLVQTTTPSLMLYRVRAKNDEYGLEVSEHPRMA